MIVKEKPFLNLDEQLEKLQNRGLTILNPQEAKQQLMRTSYYDLINGYKDMFLKPKENQIEEDAYIPGTTFDDILTIYKLDRDIRNATIKALLDIECMLYTSIAYCISEAYGEKEEDYLKKENYRIGKKQRYNDKYERDNLFYQIHKKTNFPEVQPLIYYKERYGNIPPWILVKDLTFGQLVMLYKLSADKIKTSIIQNIIGKPFIDEQTKEFFFKSIVLFNKFRNWSVHGGRMYNHRTITELPYNESFFKLLQIPKKDHNKGRGRNDYAALVIAIFFFFQNNRDEIIEFFVSINYTLTEYKKTNTKQFVLVLNELGLPNNYYSMFLEYLRNSPRN